MGCSNGENRPSDLGQDAPGDASPTRDLDLDGAPETSGDTLVDGVLAEGLPDLTPDLTPDLPPEPLRVATLNAYCFNNGPEKRIAGIADEVLQRGITVLGLQEVCQTAGDGSDNVAARLVLALEQRSGDAWEYRWTRTHLAWDKYDEGLAIVARKGAILASGEITLPQGDGFFPRKVLWGELDEGDSRFLFYVTHLTISETAEDRTAQAQAISGLLVSHQARHLPRVVVGDFNDVQQSDAISAMLAGPPTMLDTFRVASPSDPGSTCCAPNFSIRIDYIFAEAVAFVVNTTEVAFTGGL
ncbi:MAG: endonuclease/exonuclease/phosphatase family protein, partial [Deltaproteobacteria bacterium]|nr:endonuclease/exonuclease/phosphatase family protein [Deltaproteobacteria bacterium]